MAYSEADTLNLTVLRHLEINLERPRVGIESSAFLNVLPNVSSNGPESGSASCQIA